MDEEYIAQQILKRSKRAFLIGAGMGILLGFLLGWIAGITVADHGATLIVPLNQGVEL
ncbi:MAG: hypothetical protein ABJ013_16155 [Halioglobus sp.]